MNNSNDAKLQLKFKNLHGINAVFVSNNEKVYFPSEMFIDANEGDIYDITLNKSATEEEKMKLAKEHKKIFGRLFKKSPIEIVYDYYNEAIYEKLVKQLANINYVKFRRPISVLIITDRLSGVADIVVQLIRKDGDADVTCASSFNNAIDALGCSYDFIIVVGYLKDKYTYKMIQNAQNENRNCISIIYAGETAGLMVKQNYKINYFFDRHRPLKEFYRFLWKLV